MALGIVGIGFDGKSYDRRTNSSGGGEFGERDEKATSGKLVVDVIFTQSRRKYIVFQTFPSRFGNSVTLLIHIRRNNSDDL